MSTIDRIRQETQKLTQAAAAITDASDAAQWDDARPEPSERDWQDIAADTYMDEGGSACAVALDAMLSGNTAARLQGTRAAIAHKSTALLVQGSADHNGNRW